MGLSDVEYIGIIKHTSALLSAFLSKSKMYLADFIGQRPCPFECLFFAWAVRPTPRQNRRNGMACLWAMTSSRYLLALPKGNFLIAKAVSRVFWEQKHNTDGQSHEFGPWVQQYKSVQNIV